MHKRFVFEAKSTVTKEKLLKLSHHQNHFIFLDSNNHRQKYSRYDWICAFGAHKVFESVTDNPFEELQEFYGNCKDWLFGHLNYNLKNKLEKLETSSPDKLEFSLMSFFIPETIVYKEQHTISVQSYTLENEHQLFNFLQEDVPATEKFRSPYLKPTITKEEYLRAVEGIMAELQYGNIYEMNYCMEFAAVDELDPLRVFNNLNEISSAPFAAYYKMKDQYLICSSPERYLYKDGNHLISQPIKGTARRSANPEEDEDLKKELLNNEKERSENVMIVDLVRNDLSKTAARASVKVDELFGIYTFQGVHQMISTISSTLHEKFNFTDALKHSFPMGSMTGAPKISAMKIIDQYENFSRSLYAGSVGYIDPNKNFDFNVVIRSIFYNAKTHFISTRVGSAITVHCDAEQEYEECLLKAQNMFKALQY